MDSVKVSKSVYSSVTEALKDKKLTAREISDIKNKINADGEVTPDEAKLLENLLEKKESFRLTSGVSKTKVEPYTIFLSAPGFDDVKNNPGSEDFVIKSGQEGASVTKLHSLLHKADFNVNLSGETFDVNTENAVINFQKENNLEATGIVDAKTLTLLENIKGKAPSFEQIKNSSPEQDIAFKTGQKGENIKLLQTLINHMDYTLKLSGDEFNSQTESAIKNFQQQSGLKVTGVVDKDTLLELESAVAKAPPVDVVRKSAPEDDIAFRKGQKGESVKQLHILLNKVYPELNLSGDEFTAETEEAVKLFQKNNKLNITGEVDPTTLSHLEISTKADENDIYVPDDIKKEDISVSDAERVKSIVASQLTEKGTDPEKAFETGNKLLESVKKWDRKMNTDDRCYTAVKNSIQDAMKIPYFRTGQKFEGYPGSWARTAGTAFLSKQPEFVKIEGLERQDLTKLPPGAVIVYKPLSKQPGHIGVQDGNGNDISDKKRNQAYVHKTAKFEVYFPVSVRQN